MSQQSDTPDQASFYNRKTVDLMERLVGERVMTPADLLVIAETKGFNGLIRKDMVEAHRTREGEWRPGDISVTNYRGNPQINVLGCDPDRGEPQYIWLKEMQRTDDPLRGDETQLVKNPTFVKRIAEELGHGTARDAYRYAMQHIHGRNVLDPESPIRILPNVQHPYTQGRAKVDLLEGNVDNAVGSAWLAITTVRIDVDEQIRKIVEMEARRLKRPEETVAGASVRILNPQNLGWTLQKSPLLKKLFHKLQILGLV